MRSWKILSSKEYEKSLATVSGLIDGIAGFVSILSQILIGVVNYSAEWRSTFLMLTVAAGRSGLPALFFMLREYKEWKAKRLSIKDKASSI